MILVYTGISRYLPISDGKTHKMFKMIFTLYLVSLSVAQTWHISIVDSIEGGYGNPNPSLALDSIEGPHVAYYRSTEKWDGDLVYTCSDGFPWDISIVDSVSQVGLCPSLELDSAGIPYIAYIFRDLYSAQLRCAHWEDSFWVIEAVDRALSYTSLDLDSSGRPHIAYADMYGDRWLLKYAKWIGSTWEIEIVAESSTDYESFHYLGRYSSISLALDAAGAPHISYYHGMAQDIGDLEYAHRNGTEWEIVTVEAGAARPLIHGVSLALDCSGNPHISYRSCVDFPYTTLRYAQWNSHEWEIQTPDTSRQAGWDSCIALDYYGNPHISYGDTVGLKYAYWNGSIWEIEVVDEDHSAGLHTSIALDTSGNPHIVYCDIHPDHVLKYAWRE